MKILLQPSSGDEGKEHFLDTVLNGVNLDYLKDQLTSNEYNYLKSLGNNSVKVWGVVPKTDGGIKKAWLDLSPGDWVVFYANKTFIYIAQITLKTTNKKLAHTLWGENKNGVTWENMFFISEGKQIQIPYKPEVIDYKSNHIVQGVMLLNTTRSNALKQYIEDLGEEFSGEGDDTNIKYEPTKEEEKLIAERTQKVRTPDEAEFLINKISEEVKNTKVAERVRTVKALVRDPKISRLVKEKNKYICEMCGKKPFIQKNGVPYAEAHHLFELSKTRIDSPDQMICVCANCHRIIHYGNEEALKITIKNTRIKLKAT